MEAFPLEEYPHAVRLSLAHSSGQVRARLQPFFALDARLGQFVSQSKEPVLTQMRIAWWRDQLGKAVPDRPTGDPILDQIAQHWLGEDDALIALVDGWEALLSEPPLLTETVQEFAEGRAKCFEAMARLSGCARGGTTARRHGVQWALADLVTGVSDEAERELVLDVASKIELAKNSLPFRLRSLSILGRLSKNALERGGSPLIQGRADILLIMRLGLFGR